MCICVNVCIYTYRERGRDTFSQDYIDRKSLFQNRRQKAKISNFCLCSFINLM